MAKNDTTTAKNPKGGKAAASTAAVKGGKTAQTVTKVTKTAKVTNGETKVRTVGNTALSVAERRLAFVKALRQLKAIGVSAAVSGEAVQEKSGLSKFDCYCQGYKTNPLAENGLIGQTKIDGSRGLGYYLTKTGAKATDDQIKGLGGK